MRGKLAWMGLRVALCMGAAGILSPTLSVLSPYASANDHGGHDDHGAPPEPKAPKPETKDDDDLGQTPFTEYGEFNNGEEEEDNRYFQYGRFFGVSMGAGFQFLDGNRGALWQGGFPVVALKVHYWFDFNLALDLFFETASHFYDDTSTLNKGHVVVSLIKMGLDIKYYFPTKNLSAAVSFANPYVMVGGGAYLKNEFSITLNTPDQDTSLGVAAGAGLEFAISHKRSYFTLEYKINVVTFLDTFTTRYQPTLTNLTGNFHTITGSILFTW